MLTEYGVLKPDVPRPAGPADEVHERWRREWHEKYPDWKPLDPKYNIRFVPPEHLLHKVISIKAVLPVPEQQWLWAGIEFLLWAWIFLMAYVLTMY